MRRNAVKSTGRSGSKCAPNPIDVHVGSRIRLRRSDLGITQQALAQELKIAYQQVQRYERGVNRVSSSRLFDLARSLDVRPAYFFEDMLAGIEEQTPSRVKGKRKQREVVPEEFAATRSEVLTLVRAYNRITDPAVRRRLSNLVKRTARQYKD